MKVVYLGTPDFAVLPLKKLLTAGHEIVAVVTQPDKPKGRHGTPVFSPVKQIAVENSLNVLQYDKIRVEGVQDLKDLNADIFVTCAFGQILSQEIIDIPKYGILNIHASLLPKYRGAAPIQWAIINGDEYTGVTIMKTEAGIDTGDTLISKAVKIGDKETAGELFDRLSVVGAELIVDALDLIDSGKAVFVQQDDTASTHVKMLKKEDGNIDWSASSKSIDCLVRGMNPWPSAYTYYGGKIIKIWSIEICQTERSDVCGQILTSDRKNGIIVSTGDGAVKIKELQLEGSKRMSADAFLLGRNFTVGEVFNGE